MVSDRQSNGIGIDGVSRVARRHEMVGLSAASLESEKSAGKTKHTSRQAHKIREER